MSLQAVSTSAKVGRKEVNGQPAAWDTETYTIGEVERIARVAFDLAMKRKKSTSVDKANVLSFNNFGEKQLKRVAEDYPEVELNHMYVDNCAMQLVRNPRQFDVILTLNIFVIFFDEASMIAGSIGMLASASLSGSKLGRWAPTTGSLLLTLRSEYRKSACYNPFCCNDAPLFT